LLNKEKKTLMIVVFQISDIIAAISGGGHKSGIMDAISKYGGQFGLDQNAEW
jgi:hypothetical protein